jgi:hypothetical protein
VSRFRNIVPRALLTLSATTNSVREAAIALWVVSIPQLEERHRLGSPELISDAPVAGHWPAGIASLITADTLVLLNKLDLASESAEQHVTFMMMESDAITRSAGSKNPNEIALSQWWRASVTTGEGMHTFVEGLIQAVKKRYVRAVCHYDANAQCPGWGGNNE